MKHAKLITLTPVVRPAGSGEASAVVYQVHEISDSPVFPPELLAAGEAPYALVALAEIKDRGLLALEGRNNRGGRA